MLLLLMLLLLLLLLLWLLLQITNAVRQCATVTVSFPALLGRQFLSPRTSRRRSSSCARSNSGCIKV